MMNTKVSIIIPCYNYGRYLTEAVESVVQQTFQDFEIIIVNDGSTDETQNVAESLIKKYQSHRIFLINQTNSGKPAISRNKGIAASKGQYILCLDADDKIASTMIEECLKVLENDPTFSIAYTDRLDFDGVGEIVQAGDYNFDKLKYENHISYCAMYRREVWEQVGGYRPNVIGCDDWDFWVATGAKGYNGYHISKPLFKYRRHDTGRFQNSKRYMEFIKAQIILNNSEVYSQKEIEDAKNLLLQANQNRNAIQERGAKPDPKVSVIVPTYNRPETLSVALKSVLNQTYQDYEIIVINDGGSDVRSLIDDLNKEKNISYLNHATNRGLPAARNSGIKVARGKYIAYLDDDDIFYPEHLKTLVDFLETTDNKIAYTDSNRAIYKTVRGRTVFLLKEVFPSPDFDNNRILVENFIPVICVMHEKSCLDDAGNFDETLTSHEDWELWIKMSKKYSFGHIPNITCEFSWIEDDVRESHRRSEFLSTLLTIYDRYNDEAIKNPGILRAREDKLTQSLRWAYDHIKGLEIEKRGVQEEIEQARFTAQTLNAKLAAIQDNLSWRLLNRYVFSFWDKWIIPFGSKRRAVLERFFRKKVKSASTVIHSAPTYVTNDPFQSQSDKKKNRIIKKSRKTSEKNKFILYTHTQGNYFFTEIRDLIAAGIRELDYQTDIKNENEWLCEDDAWHIVVAPHEFFYLGDRANSENEILPGKLILVNTEQPSTNWFSLAEDYFPTARFIWDINYDSASRISKQDLQCKFLPLGFVDGCYLFQEVKHLPENYTTCFLKKEVKNNSFFNQSFIKRPIDISFVGALTPRRDEFFAKAASVISNYHSYIHFSDGLAAPVVPGLTTHMNTEIVLGLMQRSKIMLNIHHGADKYFEWHRIVLLGIAQKTLVISEPSLSSPIFLPGIHYVESKLKDIPEKIKYYLSTPSGIKEAEEIIERGYKKFTEECRLTTFLQPLVHRLYITKPQ
ncbi:MAG: glycosyltransferase [Bacteroidota bacterium]|nr:glycosyltransferase [Bacteroidota bacterium]